MKQKYQAKFIKSLEIEDAWLIPKTKKKNPLIQHEEYVDAIQHEEYVDAILEGLPQDYAPVVSVIESKFETPPITEIEALLLTRVTIQSI